MQHSINIKPLDEESAEVLRMSLGLYLDGECYVFAEMLHTGLDWPMVGLMQDGVIRHALVRSSDDRLFDARGFVECDATLGEPFGMGPPYVFRELKTIPLRDGESLGARTHSIVSARHIGEAVFPDLPWKDSATEKVTSFLEELEKLSRRHGVWIRAQYPGALPVVAVQNSTEVAGYELHRGIFNTTFFFDRVLDPNSD